MMNTHTNQYKAVFLWPLLLLVIFAGAQNSFAQRIGDPVPELVGTAISGEVVALSELQGKVVLIDFWASWCGPCLIEMPFLVDLSFEYADEDLEIVAINIDDESVYMHDFLARLDTFPPFPIIADSTRAIASRFNLDGMPTTVFVDRAGLAYYIHTGFRREDKQLYRDKLDELFARF